MKNELYDSNAEEYLIGACMVDSSALETIRTLVSSKDFFTRDNELVFESILNVADTNDRVDPVSVYTNLNKRGELNRAGGMNRIYELQAVIAETETENVEAYAKIVADFARRREIIVNSTDIIAKAKDTGLEIDDVVGALLESTETLSRNEKHVLTIQSAHELSTKEFEPIKWIIPNFLPTGLTILAGPAKIGKSFLCWNLAFASALQGLALERFDIDTPSNVLYLALDDDERLLQERHKMIMNGETLPENVFIADNSNLITFNPAGLHKIEQIINEKSIELLIVDTWMHVRPEVLNANGKTAYDIDYQALIPIQRFAHRKNISILLVTHTRKGADLDNPFNQIQGSMGMQAGCDTLMMLSRGDNGHATLKVAGRRVQDTEYLAELKNGGIWSVVGDADDFCESDAVNEIVELLLECQGTPLTPTQIQEETGLGKNTVAQRLKKAVKESVAVKVGRGQYIHANFHDAYVQAQERE